MDRNDFKKELEKAKAKLYKFSQEATVIAKKGEAELMKLSHRARLHLDTTTLDLKKEHLYYSIGKEYVKNQKSGTQSEQIKKLIDEFKKIQKEQNSLKARLKAPR